MNHNLVHRGRLIAPILALALAACAMGPSPGAVTATTASVSTQEIDWIQAALMQGNSKAAKKKIKLLLKRDPMSPRLLLLRDSIDEDPVELLGPSSYPYTVRSGDTVTSLAERLLGNPLKAYQLARYNGLRTPVELIPGQTIQIPGALRPLQPQPVPDHSTRTPSNAAAPNLAPVKPDVPPAAAKPIVNSAAAQRARAAGLAALNRGAVTEAVGLLQQAHSLDRGNALILRDLQRAQRIAKTVRSKK